MPTLGELDVHDTPKTSLDKPDLNNTSEIKEFFKPKLQFKQQYYDHIQKIPKYVHGMLYNKL